jgi:phosphoadenosine phosphosulfate reductase
VQQRAGVRKSLRSNVAGLKMGFDQEAFIAESKEMRLKHLEEQAMFALKTSCENFENPVFPNAMIAGDCVITHLLGRLGYLESGKCKIMVVDTFHLFDETMPFLASIERTMASRRRSSGRRACRPATRPRTTRSTARTSGVRTLSSTTRSARSSPSSVA